MRRGINFCRKCLWFGPGDRRLNLCVDRRWSEALRFCRTLWWTGGERWWSWKCARYCVEYESKHLREMMGEALTALASPDPHTRPSPRRCSQVLATMDTRAHCLRAPSPRRSAPRTEPAGAARGIQHLASCLRPRPPRLLAEGGYPTPPLQPGKDSRIAKANVELNVWSASNCFPWLRKEEVEYKHIPPASANTTAERRGLLDFERWTQLSSNFNNYWELSMCQGPEQSALYMSYFIVRACHKWVHDPHFTDENTEARELE